MVEIKNQLLAGYDDIIVNLETIPDPFATVAGAVSTSSTQMGIPTANDARILAHRSEIEHVLDRSMRPMEHLLASYQGEYSDVLRISADAYIQAWRERSHDLAETIAELQRLEVCAALLLLLPVLVSHPLACV